MRVLLILPDGMRPDAIKDMPIVQEYLKNSTYDMNAQTVVPSVTLPAHMSLFHSVDPSRHGTTTNMYMPQVRPIKGLCEVLLENGKTNAFFYNWEEIRDLARPNSLSHAYFVKGRQFGYDKTNDIVTDAAIDFLSKTPTDFAFLYLGYSDMAGHQHGWMTDEYHEALRNSWENIDKVVNALPDDYVFIITADHGGHDRIHGTEAPEDMTIPIIITGKGIEKGKEIKKSSLKDIAPTIAKLLGAEPDEEWEGKSLL